MQEVLIHGNLLKRFDSDKSKSDVDKLDIGKLETTLVDLSKLNNVVKEDIVKKSEYDTTDY